MTTVLEFENVARSYKRGKPVLEGVTFSVEAGEVVALLGRNGCGKTTLINIAMGMLAPHAGNVRVLGLSPTVDPVAMKKRIGYVAEDQILPGGSTIEELVCFHRHLFNNWDSGLERDLMTRFQLDPGTIVGRLSKGQARQVALLCAVCHHPELLLLDEPAAGLDPVVRRDFLETSVHLLNETGATILFSSHQMQDVERISGRAVFLDEGRVKLDRSLDALREKLCVAVIPRSALHDPKTLRQMPGCLRIRQVHEEWHAVFEGNPQSVRQRLVESGFTGEVQCRTVPLEELFIELVGGDRKEPA